VSGRRKRGLWAAGVAALTGAVFLPALRNGFVNWDDPATLLSNEAFRGFDAARLRWMFASRYMGNYQPLTWLSYAVDFRLWGLDPRGYHLTSVLLHAANAALFFLVAARLLERARPATDEAGERRLLQAAGLAALLFALHPLRVESVAWASERRDVLAATFYLACVLAYLRAHERSRTDRRWLAASFGALTLSLLAKGSAVVAPAALLVLDFYPLRRLGVSDGSARGVWLEKALFAVPAAAAGAIGLLGQVSNGASMTLSDYGWIPRLEQAGYALVFYLGKCVVPLRLSPLYLHPSLDPRSPLLLAPAAAALALSAAAAACARRRPAVAALWAYYVVVLAPVLGLIPFGMQVAADRYTYLSCLGWAAAAGAALRAWLDRPWARACAAAAVLSLAILCARQEAVWRDSTALWTRALSVDPRDPVAHANLGNALAQSGRLDEAIAHYRAALSVSPRFAKAWDNLGVALAQTGREAEARSCFATARALAPEDAMIAGHLERMASRRTR